MPPEKLTGTGSGYEWASFEERDEVFGDMRNKAISLIDPIDLISIGTNDGLLEKYTTYNFNNPDAELSSVIKNVIWGLFNNPDARENLFPKWIQTEDDLNEFLNNKEKHLDPVARSFINFVILSVRSGIKAIPEKRRIEEHIAFQLTHFLEKLFKDWKKTLNIPLDAPIGMLTAEQGKLRVRVLDIVKNSEQLHSEIFSKYSEEGSMNVYGYFLRVLLGIEQAGAKVKGIMVEVIDKKFDHERKEFLELIDKFKAESKEKVRKEKETIIAVAADETNESAKAAHISAAILGKVTSMNGQKIPVSGRITQPDEQELDEDAFIEDESGGEVTFVDPKFIPDRPKPKISRRVSPTDYSLQTREVTDPGAPVPDRSVEPQPVESAPVPAVADVGERPVSEKPAEIQVKDMIPTPLSRKIADMAAAKEAPVPVPALTLVPAPTPTPTPIPAPAPVITKRRKVETDEITLPELPALAVPELEKLPSEAQKILTEKDPRKRIEKMEAWFADHPKSVKAVIFATVMAVLGGAVLLTYRASNKEKPERVNVASKKTTDDKNIKTIIPPMRAEPSMDAEVAMTAEPIMHVAKQRPVPREVMKANQDFMAPRPITRPITRPKPAPVVAPQKTVDVKGAISDDQTLSYIDTKSLSNLKDGIYKDMWEGKSFDISDAPFSSISGFMEKQLKEMANKFESKKDRKNAERAYYSELRELEKGWLLYMSIQESTLLEKSMKGTLSADENTRLKNWDEYKKTHRARKWQAKWLHSQYIKLQASKKKGLAYYNSLAERGKELMNGLSELNPGLVDPNNVPRGQQVKFADGNKVLKTFWRFATAMNLPKPGKGMSTTGSIESPQTHIMFAENNIPVDDTTPIQDSDILSIENLQPTYGMAAAPELKPILAGMIKPKPPVIPKDARVYEIREEDIIDRRMAEPKAYGAAPLPELKPILKEMMVKRQTTPPPIPEAAYLEIDDSDIIEELPITPPSYVEYKVEKDIPMYGAAPLPKEIKPILKEMRVKRQTPPPIPADARVKKVPEYVSYEATPEPAIAAVQQQEPTKKGLWGKVKGWFSKKAA